MMNLPASWIRRPGTFLPRWMNLPATRTRRPGRFADVLEHQPFVTAITRPRVVVRRAEMMWGIAPPSTTGKSDRIPWAKSSAGIQTMREELERQLGDQQDEQERWTQALTNWASGSPAAGGR
jgi:hypothetical protein